MGEKKTENWGCFSLVVFTPVSWPAPRPRSHFSLCSVCLFRRQQRDEASWCHISGLHLRHHTSPLLSRLIYFGFQLLILIRRCESDGLWQAAVALNLRGHMLHHCTQLLLRFMAGFERSSSWLFSKGLNLESYWKTVEQPPGRNGVGGGFFSTLFFPLRFPKLTGSDFLSSLHLITSLWLWYNNRLQRNSGFKTPFTVQSPKNNTYVICISVFCLQSCP